MTPKESFPNSYLQRLEFTRHSAASNSGRTDARRLLALPVQISNRQARPEPSGHPWIRSRDGKEEDEMTIWRWGTIATLGSSER